MKKSVILLVVFSMVGLLFCSNTDSEIKIGLIGLDTSHAPAYARMLNDASYKHHLPGARIVCAYPGGSPDVESSHTRVEKFTKQVASYDVEIVRDISSMLDKVDVVILTSVDGRVHLEQVKPVIAAGKPVFVDKPMAASLADVKEIFRLANEAGVPCFSASSLRYYSELQNALKDKSLGKVIGCDAYSPAKLEPHHPDLMWYGVHGIEILFTAMGGECKSVRRIFSEGTDVVVGEWSDGRLGTFRGIRDGNGGYGATVFFEKGVRYLTPDTGTLYVHLMKEILEFFKTGKSPILQQDTIAMFEFMEAADKSKEKSGQVIELQ
jgi:predicted dehydrogenase